MSACKGPPRLSTELNGKGNVADLKSVSSYSSAWCDFTTKGVSGELAFILSPEVANSPKGSESGMIFRMCALPAMS